MGKRRGYINPAGEVGVVSVKRNKWKGLYNGLLWESLLVRVFWVG
jgi:hypothetical protein